MSAHPLILASFFPIPQWYCVLLLHILIQKIEHEKTVISCVFEMVNASQDKIRQYYKNIKKHKLVATFGALEISIFCILADSIE